LIFVKSQKNAKNGPDPEGPFPAEVDPTTGKLPLVTRGPRKGQPVSNRLQYYKGNENNLQPMSQHSYLAYLPTVEFGPGITSASQIRAAWPKLNDKRKTAMVMSLYPSTQKNPKLAANVVAMLDQAMGGQENVAEAKRKKKKKSSRSMGGYFFPGYAYYGSVDSGESGGDGGGESVDRGMAEGFSDDMSTQDMIAYLRQHHDKNLHSDYVNHVTNTNSKFVLKNIPLTSIRTELSGLDKEKVEQYKKMDFSKAPPIVVGSDGNILDGYHRANVAKALGIPTVKAYVGIKEQGVAEEVMLDEGPFVPRIMHPNKVNIYLNLGIGKEPRLVATDISYEILDKYIQKVIQKYPQFKPTNFSFRASDKVNEGNDDDIWGPQGNFAGDKPVNIGGDIVKKLQVGDIVTYFGQKARIEAMSKTGNTSRITIANKIGGITQDVITRDLKRTGMSEEIGGVGGGFGTNYPGTYEEENGPFTHKGGLKLTSLTTESVDYLDEK
jgi:hypothetical protein